MANGVWMVIVLVGGCASSYGTFIDDYSWRDYDGTVPIDVFEAGLDRDGQPIYIGQTLFENKLVPGKIYHEANEIHIEFAEVHIVNETLKILCTNHPEKFEWIKTHYDEILDLKSKHHIFEGGYEQGYTTYIGRALSHGELTVGKIICFNDGCYKLTTTEENKWYDHNEFEILTYNPDATSERDTNSPSSYYEEQHYERAGFWTYFMIFVSVVGLSALVIFIVVRKC